MEKYIFHNFTGNFTVNHIAPGADVPQLVKATTPLHEDHMRIGAIQVQNATSVPTNSQQPQQASSAPTSGAQYNRNFVCQCLKKFSHKCSLTRHQKKCGKAPDIPCPHCPNMYYRKDLLKTHILTKHYYE